MAKENGYLAVDFFFVLSGFVIGYAYDDRWSLNAQQLYIGFTRLLYPFLCGLLISRILPAVHHALSADVHADELGGRAS